MNKEPSWKLPADALDWECDWDSSRRFQLNYWASLTLQEIIEALEEMAEMDERLSPITADPFAGKQAPGCAAVREDPPLSTP